MTASTADQKVDIKNLSYISNILLVFMLLFLTIIFHFFIDEIAAKPFSQL